MISMHSTPIREHKGEKLYGIRAKRRIPRREEVTGLYVHANEAHSNMNIRILSHNLFTDLLRLIKIVLELFFLFIKYFKIIFILIFYK